MQRCFDFLDVCNIYQGAFLDDRGKILVSDRPDSGDRSGTDSGCEVSGLFL